MLKLRIFTATVLLAVLSMFWLPPFYWERLMAVVAALAAWEWGAMAGLKTRGRPVLAIACLCLAAFEQTNLLSLWGLLCAPFFWCLIAPFWLWRRWRLNRTRAGRGLLVCLGFCLILTAWGAFSFLRVLAGEWELLAMLGILPALSLSAWFAGRKSGGRAFAPDINPGKTWASLYGALAGGLCYGIFLVVLMLWPLEPYKWEESWRLVSILLFAPLFAVLGVMGDIFMTFLKHQAGMGEDDRLLPRHGSLLAILSCCFPLFAFLFVPA
ncbi:MAG: phosphatidate cytidylyltransferase [Zoogloeaceae bacterium]|nr:phosphatidate cytidylyltransferase [Zoogloeaceae bacterium]